MACLESTIRKRSVRPKESYFLLAPLRIPYMALYLIGVDAIMQLQYLVCVIQCEGSTSFKWRWIFGTLSRRARDTNVNITWLVELTVFWGNQYPRPNDDWLSSIQDRNGCLKCLQVTKASIHHAPRTLTS